MPETYRISVPAWVVEHLGNTRAWTEIEQRGQTDVVPPDTAAAFHQIMNGTLRAKGAILAAFTVEQLSGLLPPVRDMRDAEDVELNARRAAATLHKRLVHVLDSLGGEI